MGEPVPFHSEISPWIWSHCGYAQQAPRLPSTRLPGVLKLTLQLLVCLTIGLRCAALFGHLRRAWIADGLPAEFQRELRRRGLLIRSPAHPND